MPVASPVVTMAVMPPAMPTTLRTVVPMAAMPRMTAMPPVTTVPAPGPVQMRSPDEHQDPVPHHHDQRESEDHGRITRDRPQKAPHLLSPASARPPTATPREPPGASVAAPPPSAHCTIPAVLAPS